MVRTVDNWRACLIKLGLTLLWRALLRGEQTKEFFQAGHAGLHLVPDGLRQAYHAPGNGRLLDLGTWGALEDQRPDLVVYNQ